MYSFFIKKQKNLSIPYVDVAEKCEIGGALFLRNFRCMSQKEVELRAVPY